LPLTSSEVGAYIQHRLGVANGDISVFSKATIRSAFDITGGIPRVINLLCDRALTLTFTKQLPVVSQHIFIAAAQQILGEDVVQQRQGKRWTYTLLGVFLVATALGFAIGQLNA
jgi:general secretion pathway protein A